MDDADLRLTRTHRLILPGDSNHHGTLYAGSLLRIALEAGYATAFRHIGESANILLRRVLSVECYLPVPVGSVVEIHGLALHVTQAYLVVGLVGVPTPGFASPWMDALMGFVQVDENGRPKALPQRCEPDSPPDADWWKKLQKRLPKLLAIR